MKLFIYAIVYILSYLFGAFAFPQIIGSIRMIKIGIITPYLFTLIFWLIITVAAITLMHIYLSKYFIAFIIALVIPFILTLTTKNIQ